MAIGAAAGMAASTRLLFAALFLSALLVGLAGLDAVPTAVFAATRRVAHQGRARPAGARYACARMTASVPIASATPASVRARAAPSDTPS